MIKRTLRSDAALEEPQACSATRVVPPMTALTNITPANARDWQTNHFTGPGGWTDRLVTAVC